MQDLLADAGIQAVYIPVPTGLRTDVVMKAIAAKKHVLVEKPMASVAETKRMIDACKAAKVQFMDNTMFVHNKRQDAMRKILDDGELFGQLKHVHSTFSIGVGLDESWAEQNIRMKKALEPLGCLGDLGWYNTRFTLWAFNYASPVSVSCNVIEHTEENVPTHVMAQMRFEGGRTASFMCSFRCAFRHNAELFGEHATVSLEDFVVASVLDTAKFKVVRTGFGPKAETFPVEVVKDEEVSSGVQHDAVVETFSSMVASGQVDDMWPQQTLQTQTVLDAMVLSAARSGAWVLPLSKIHLLIGHVLRCQGSVQVFGAACVCQCLGLGSHHGIAALCDSKAVKCLCVGLALPAEAV